MQFRPPIMEKTKLSQIPIIIDFTFRSTLNAWTDHQPFYQAGLADRLSYELTFNNYSKVIESTDVNAKYNISGISLEYEVVTNAELARMIKNQYRGKMAILYDRVLRHRIIPLNKKDQTWNINLNTPTKTMKGILLLFKEPTEKSTSKLFNPKIDKISITIEGVPNQLYAQGMRRYQHWEEIQKYFGDSREEHAIGVTKALNLSDMRLKDYLVDKYGLFLDMRSNDDNTIYGSGRRVENASKGITIQLEKAEAAGGLNCYIYVIMDAQLNIKNGRYHSAIY